MINAKTGERELCYVVKIDAIEPIVGSDNCEAAIVGGWKIMTRKGTFQAGDLAIYFEIDSKVPETEQFAFLEKKHYKIKTQKYTFGGKGNFISQGLLMSAKDFGGTVCQDGSGIFYLHINGKSYAEGEFLTKDLGVTYAVTSDNKRKANSVDKYKKMAQRRPDIFKKKWAQWFMRRNWGKKLMFFFFGKKKDKRSGWPAWVSKTDEERIQNLVSMIPSFQTEKWIPTEKIDGTSTTFTMKRKIFGNNEFYVCSRNVVFDRSDKNCYYDTNVYIEMAEKYNIKNVLEDLLRANPDADFVTIQGETYGKDIQKRDYSIDYHDFVAFNLIFGYRNGTKERYNPKDMASTLCLYAIPCVPFFEPIDLPDTCDEILALAAGESAIDGLPREGLVFRTLDGVRSFKAVDNGFLIKYHG